MTRILIIGDAVATTGFARVIRSIFTPLQTDFEFHSSPPAMTPWQTFAMK
jgi:hypothetical protein